MASKLEITSGKLLECWLKDIGCSPVRQTLPGMNWAFQISYPPGAPQQLNITVANPTALPRGVFIGCHITPAPQHVAAFSELEADDQKEFWQRLRTTLNRENVEFQLEGVPPNSCPMAFQVSAIRYDDGLTLDSFARSISSVLKGCIDGMSCFQDRLGEITPAPGNDFTFRKLGTQ